MYDVQRLNELAAGLMNLREKAREIADQMPGDTVTKLAYTVGAMKSNSEQIAKSIESVAGNFTSTEFAEEAAEREVGQRIEERLTFTSPGNDGPELRHERVQVSTDLLVEHAEFNVSESGWELTIQATLEAVDIRNRKATYYCEVMHAENVCMYSDTELALAD